MFFLLVFFIFIFGIIISNFFIEISAKISFDEVNKLKIENLTLIYSLKLYKFLKVLKIKKAKNNLGNAKISKLEAFRTLKYFSIKNLKINFKYGTENAFTVALIAPVLYTILNNYTSRNEIKNCVNIIPYYNNNNFFELEFESKVELDFIKFLLVLNGIKNAYLVKNNENKI